MYLLEEHFMWHLPLFVTEFLSKLYWLVVAHFICDFILQGDTMAREKNPLVTQASDHRTQVPWSYWMLAHAATHGAAVALIMNNILYGVAETFFHFSIDYMKCRRLLTFDEDQAAHLTCKLIFLLLWVVR